jgi:hypothetical protein
VSEYSSAWIDMRHDNALYSHVRALRPSRLRSQELPGPDGPRRRSPAILVAGEGFLNWRP